MQKRTPETGDIIPVCNGYNSSKCTEVKDILKKKYRRDYKRAAPGDPDYAEQQA